MELTELEAESGKFSLRGECPHCWRHSVFIQVTTVSAVEVSAGHQRIAVGMQCQGCLDYILALAMKTRRHPMPSSLAYVKHYPLGTPDDTVDENVPKAIANDFAEAMRCLWVKSYKATVAMCRKSVEAACKREGATGRNLEKKLDRLEAKGIITEPLKQMAHAVRISGNKGVHGKKKEDAPEAEESALAIDDLDSFSPEESEAMIAFTKEFFHHVYVMPALLEKYKPKPKGEASDET